ncbi:MAG: bifunctional [glutamate--ammonia ligase]-adenylyl-L-tyrosine phosphorylase/[glutamate--ammonia-ligase] adenylyltransferase [Haemophilus parainfluenzae]|nr:bifunctional [glutamate--ammonia ligase]-adenylyl-L-tyrosine phosphorylase/[glutamate--ammonia-ligase] adenylyltransferase [Haemophilus parainfluenzae]
MMALSLPLSTEKLIQLGEVLCQHFPEMNLDEITQQIEQEATDLTTPIGQINYAISLSNFLEKVLKKQPHFLAQWWQTPPQFSDCQHYASRLADQLSAIQNEEQLYKTLRDFRNQEMAKLSFCQSLNLATVEEIFIRLSQLAESLIIGTRDWLYKQACEEMGTPCDENGNPQQLYILGMGKLGGFELNFSSDIDLIFTYPSQGETVGTRRAVGNAKFFTRLGQRLINALDQFTPDGFVYRTDMRLRPFGDSGALALSFSAMEQYYQDQGRDWERYAMIKGRILGANEQDPNVKTLQQLLRPFVYRRYIDFSVIQALREMKGKIEREVRRRGLKDNIKLGAGGIREIEFIVQVFQLIRGGRELPEIRDLSLITPQQYHELRDAYIFLRHTENVLQAIDDQQTQLLPTDEENRLRLMVACREYTYLDEKNQTTMKSYPIKNWDDFYQILQAHQQKVRSVFDALIGEEKDERTDDNNHNHIDEDAISDILDKLIQFKEGLARRVIGSRGREVLAHLLPDIFTQIFEQKNYRTLLPRILNIVDKIASRTTYLELLLENPQAIEQLIELCSQSQMIAEQVARFPILLDELLNTKALRNPLPFTQYPDELKQYMLRLPQDDEEQFIDGLRQFKQSILLRVASADILDVLPVMKVSDHLTYLAEAIIDAVVNFAWQQVSQRFGVPEYLVGKTEKGFLVIGYGKLGGIELGYKSDLDLVFFVSIFSMNTSAGILYDVDMRLRPSGDAGLLGCSLQAFENYQLNEAWTWEKQALVRSRAIFGETELKAEFEKIRCNVLSAQRDINQLKIEVRDMREKMYEHLSHTKEGFFNIKTDRGGITDIEFIAQYLMLANAPANPILTKWSDNVRIFDSMAEYHIISLAECEKLKSCYVTLRNKIHHLNLLGNPVIVDDSAFAEEREFVCSFWYKLFS